jgi:hypothetical protein
MSMDIKKKTISTKNALPIWARNIPPVIFSAIAGLTAINPTWSILFATSTALINAWGDFGQTRVNELVSFINEHKEEFMADVIQTDKFKTLFLNILERHMKEASEEKRQLLRNYLLSVGKGVNPNFNEFTRMNNILDTISLEEIDFLKLWDSDNAVGSYINKHLQQPHALTMSDIQSCVYNMTPRDSRLMAMIDNQHQSKNNQILISLSYKGLLYGLTQDNFGSGQEVRIKEITPFGRAFLAFIKG